MEKLIRTRLGCVFVAVFYATSLCSAQTLTTLVNFDGTNGSSPQYGSLVQGLDGNLYGVTELGGANLYGTFFRVTVSGKLTTLCSFGPTASAFRPLAITLADGGNFYGVSTGSSSGPFPGYGAIFEISPAGSLTALRTFNGIDGDYPLAGLVQAANGDFYGATSDGGSENLGNIFRVSGEGAFTNLHQFSGGVDGEFPDSSLIQASNGNLYGTTYLGGNNTDFTDGTIFKITPEGAFTTVYAFNYNDGANPEAALIQASDGNFYGTTSGGGTSSYGTVFKFAPAGTLTTLHNFVSTDGAVPVAPLIQATDGHLYGTTQFGGANDRGTVFRISIEGSFTTLHSFDLSDGGGPTSGLLQATDGKFYGTTLQGGTSPSEGTVFSLDMGLGPFVKLLPAHGVVGGTVKILGTDLTGALSVTFNGTAAAFTVITPTEISATVPMGATTGPVQVVTPSATLSSNVPFLTP